MTILCYESGKWMIMATCYKGGNDHKYDNNKDKVCLLLRK